jgi:DNA (cytosine-5)-methyltransferase 1
MPGTSGTIRIVDLFSGCGGLSLGAHEAARRHRRRFKIALAVEIDDSALGVYRDNFGVNESIARRVDVCQVFGGRLNVRLSSRELNVRRACGRVDLLIAGPPCQGHSDLNNSSRRLDPRNSLYLRVVRAARVLRPRTVIIENVPAVIHDRGRVVARATNGLEELGYHVTTCFIAADRIGLAQSRRRHILIAVRDKKFELGFLEFPKLEQPKTVRDYIGDLVGLNGSRRPLFDYPSKMTKKNQSRARFLFENSRYDLPNWRRPECHHDDHSYVSMYGRLCWTKPAQTITSGFGSMGQGRFLHPSRLRTLTPHEAARLQGFPDFFRFSSIGSRTSLHTTIGNAVPPKLAAVLVDQLIAKGYL